MSPKNKLQLLLLAIPVAAFLSYSLGIRRTIEAYRESKALEQKMNSIRDIPRQTALLSQKALYLDSLLAKKNLGGTSFENNLIKALSAIADSLPVAIKDFNSTHHSRMDDIMVNTYNFELSGEFTGILKTIYSLETEGNYGEIVHVRFYTDRKNRNRRKRLNAVILLQQVQ